MNTWTVSGTVLINNRRIVCKGERKRVVLVKGSKWDETNNMKAQLNVFSHEMCSESKKRLAQMILILGSSKWPPISFNDSRTIADDSLWGLEWTFGTNLLRRQCTSPNSREWRSPPSTWEYSIFQKAAPLILKRIKVNRVHYRLRWWGICSWWWRRELRPLWAEIFFILVF